MLQNSILPFALLALCEGIHAARLSLQGRPSPPGTNLHRRSSISGHTSSLNDSQNLMYFTDIALNGETVQATIDTGSSDLWVTYTIPGAKDQGFNSTVTYDVGQVSGPVQAATFGFAGYEVPDQFFMLVPEAEDSAGSNALIGLGPSQGSMIRFLGNSSAADPPLDRIFKQNTSTPNYLSILLGRSDDPEEPYPGDLTVGEVLSNYTDILDQPKLNVTIANFTVKSTYLGQHWQTLLDQNGIIGPDGKAIPIKTEVNNSVDPNKATVFFDTGYTFPQVPEYVAEAIYGKVNGSSLQNITELGGAFWVVPCDEEINATFIFAGVHYPIHPLDLNFAVEDDFCIGAFQPVSYAVQEGLILYDMILGMAFLRNAYLLVNFGDFVDGSNSTTAPHIQLLSVTNATQASEEFAQQRKNGTTLDDLANDLLRTTTKSTGKKIAAWIIGVIVVCVVLGLLLLGLCCVCLCRKRNKRGNAGPRQIWPPSQSYRSISDPTPQGADEMHLVHNADPVYNPEQAYRTAWDPNYRD